MTPFQSEEKFIIKPHGTVYLGPDVPGGKELSVLLSDRCVGVELQHGPDVLQRVSLGLLGLDDGSVGGPQDLPDLLRLEQLAEVGVGHLGHGQVPALLGLGGLLPGAVQAI